MGGIVFGVVPAIEGEDDPQTFLRGHLSVPFRIGSIGVVEALEYAEGFLHSLYLTLESG
jgi:hypothetical protein